MDYPGSARALVEQMDRYGVEKALIMPPPGAAARVSEAYYSSRAREYDAILAAVKEHPGRLFIAGGGHNLNAMIHSTPASSVTDDIRASFREEAEEIIASGAKAFGEIAALHIAPHALDEVSPDHPLFLLLADIAAENNIPIDLHMDAIPSDMAVPEMYGPRHASRGKLRANIPALERLLDHNKRARIVWQHLGWDFPGKRTIALTRRLLKKHPNLYMAVRAHPDTTIRGQSIDLPNRLHDKAGKIKPEWLALFQEFSDRIVVGSDEFFGPEGILQGTGTQPAFGSSWSLLGHLPPGLARKIGKENASRIYGL